MPPPGYQRDDADCQFESLGTGLSSRIARTIVSAELYKRRQVQAIGGIAIGPSAYELPVQPDHAVRHCTINVEEYGFAGIARGYIQIFPVPNNSGRRQSSRAAAHRRGEWAFDGIIVRQIHFLPGAVIKIRSNIGHAVTQIALRALCSLIRIF